MTASRERERLTVILAPVVEVGDEEGRTAALDELIEILQRHIEVRSTALRLEAQELTYQIEDVLAPTSRRDEEFDLVGEEDRTDLVIILYRGEGQGRCDLGIELALGLDAGTKVRTPRHIDQEHHGQLTLLLKDLDEGVGIACRDIPVQVTHVIAYLITTYLAKGHTSSTEGGLVLPRKDLLREATGLDLDAAHLA